MAQSASRPQESRQNAPSRQGAQSEMASLFEGSASGLVRHLKEFAAENPAGAAVWCFGIGFVLGWRLKPW